MNYYFITGTSHGLGKSIAVQLLQRSNVHVYGISRSCSIQHVNYTHISVDLSDLSQLIDATQLFKQKFSIDDNLYLVNNAGIVDPIKHVKNFTSNEIQRIFNVNLISVVELTNAFLQIPDSTIKTSVIVNISSGAASKVIDGWSLYGSSKAALDYFALHVAKELEIDGHVNTRIFLLRRELLIQICNVKFGKLQLVNFQPELVFMIFITQIICCRPILLPKSIY